MIPLSDDNSLRKSFPLINYLLIAINFFVFFLELSAGETFIKDWAFIPSQFIAHPAANISSLFTSMFMHAGWAHLLGNMLYLWIFGDNVEDRFGKTKYLLFYLASGIAATFAQLIINPTSSVPNLGASGAIAGVLGAYIVFFPQGKVNVMIGLGVTQMSALLVIGFWFLVQFISQFTSLSESGDNAGVAYMAHIGGFVAGLIMAIIFRASEKTYKQQ